MSNQPISRSIIDDNRAVSTVIGVVILFGFLILALSLYQVEAVPQQNAETEFQHSGEVRNDLVELRAGILQAGSIDQPQYQTVQLGTTYSTRVFTINPPAPAGTIRTSDSYNITIENESGVSTNISTRFIQYRPGYNELDRSPTWYDASVLYVDARDEGGGIAVIEDQALVNGGEVQITALQNEFRKSGTGQVTVELRPAESVTTDIPEGDLTVTIPTRLSDDEYWSETDIPTDTYDVTNDDTYDGDVYNLTLETTASNLTVDTVGVQEAPENPTQNNAARVGGDKPGEDLPAESELSNVGDTIAQGDDNSQVQFVVRNNNANPVTVTGISVDGSTTDANDGKVNNGNNDPEVTLADGTELINKGGNDGIVVGGGTNDFNAPVEIESGQNKQFKLAEFLDSISGVSGDPVDMRGDELSITLYYDGGSQSFTLRVREDGDFEFDDYDGDGNIFATGDVTIPEEKIVTGKVDAGGDVELKSEATVEGTIDAGGDVELKDGVTAGDIDAGGDIELKDGVTAGDITTTNGAVTLKSEAETGSIEATDAVTIESDAQSSDVDAGGDIELKDGVTAGDITTTNGDVTLKDGAKSGIIGATGDVTVGSGAESDDISTGGDVELKEGATAQSISTGSSVTLKDDVVVNGDVSVNNGNMLDCGEGVMINNISCEQYKKNNY